MMNEHEITVFDFACWWQELGCESVEHRLVAAFTEEEAEEKFKAYSDRLVEQGCCRLISCGSPTVAEYGVVF